MKDFIKNKLRGGLLIENKLYTNKMVDAVTKKIGDSSEDTKNKINIAGLWRDYFGNIQQLKSKEQLDTVFKSWYDEMMSDIIKTTLFYNNKDLAEKYLNAYIENIGSLENKATKFSLKKNGKRLVDLVNNNNWIKDTSVSTNSIEKPYIEDILYEDDDIIILNAPNKSKCVTYGQGESWCIGQPELNQYNTYRLNNGATPYYVLQKNIEGDEHKLVIMNYGNGKYAIADRSNSGDRIGTSQFSMSWGQIEQEIPNLNGKEQFFKHREITDNEIKYAEALEDGYEGDDLQSYFDKLSKELVVNGENVKSVDIVRDYAANLHKISPEQFNTLRDDVKDSLIESKYFINNGSDKYNLTDKQLARIVRLKKIDDIDDFEVDYNPLTYNELMTLNNDERNKYIEYLNSGSNFSMKFIRYLFENSKDTYAVIKLLGQKGIDFIQNLNGSDIGYLLNNSTNPDAIIKLLLSTEGFIQNLDYRVFSRLLQNSSNPDVVMKTLGQKGVEFIRNLNTTNTIDILIKSSKPDTIIKELLSHKVFIDNMEDPLVFAFLTLTENPDKLESYLKKVRPDLFKQNESRNIIKNLLRESLICEDVELSKEEFFKQNNIDPEELSHMGNGDFGDAYSIGDGRVLKITRSKSEFDFAKELVGKNIPALDGFVDFYVADIVDGRYYIIMEELEEDYTIENMYHQVEDLLSHEGLPIQYLHMLDTDELNLDEDILSFISDIEDINHSYRYLGIEASDIKPDNLGVDKNGKIKAFDIDDRSINEMYK